MGSPGTFGSAEGQRTGDQTPAAAALIALSAWIDSSPGYVGCDPETVLWRRVTKVASEAGEAIDALAGAVGENPRKGVTGTLDDVIEELLDAAVAALGAVEHVTGNHGRALPLLEAKILRVARRAGLLDPPPTPDTAGTALTRGAGA